MRDRVVIRYLAGSVSDNPVKWKLKTEAWRTKKTKARKKTTFRSYQMYWVPNRDTYDIVVTDGDRVVGDLFYGQSDDGSSLLGAVEVDPEYRRKGIATAMYSWAEKLHGQTFVPDLPHTPAAEAFWRQRNRPFGRYAAQKEVIRPEGWNAANDVPSSWTRSGHLYRGVSEAEFRFIRSKGVIRSNESWSLRGEGTNFSDDAGDAESYVNYGRTDPRKTHRPNYLIEVKKDDTFKRWPDGYWKAPEVPKSQITRVWKMEDEGDTVVASLVHI